jgi:quercetin dioxygenase-like cupin family protein
MNSRIILLLVAIGFAAILLFAQTTGEVELTAEPVHHLVLENEYIRVFKVDLVPHASTLVHRHRHDYVFVSLGPSEITNAVVGKPPVSLTLQDGETRFSAGNFAHAVTNNASTPFRALAVEFLQDEAAHKNPPPPWDEERGLHEFDGGTHDILFVKDGVRVSEIELNPGAVMPSHHHSGPHLLVAVTDLEIRSDVEGQGPMPGHFQSGDVKWLPGGYTHTVTNVGKQKAKFVTLEFR